MISYLYNHKDDSKSDESTAVGVHDSGHFIVTTLKYGTIVCALEKNWQMVEQVFALRLLSFKLHYAQIIWVIGHENLSLPCRYKR